MTACGRTLNGFLSNAASAVAVGVLGVIVLAAIFGPLLWPDGALTIHLADKLSAPSWSHPMGTDDVGRDVFARFLEGARISLLTGLAAVAGGSIIGGLIGLFAGALGGIVDAVLMRCMDALLAF